MKSINETILLCLHLWGEHGHPSLMNPDEGEVGNGPLLFFRVNDFKETWGRAKFLGAKIVEEPHFNSFAGHNEFTLRDLDGPYVPLVLIKQRKE